MLYTTINNVKDEYELSLELKKYCNINDLIVLQFSASWCAPCKTIKSIIDKDSTLLELSKKYKTGIHFFYIDIEANEILINNVKEFNINSVPTFNFCKFVKGSNGSSWEFIICENVVRGSNFNELKNTISELLM
jgi:thiol-disulfide isomerase/thioredoxin